MMVAGWSITAKFGYKLNVIDLKQRCLRKIEPHVVSGTSRWEIYRVL